MDDELKKVLNDQARRIDILRAQVAVLEIAVWCLVEFIPENRAAMKDKFINEAKETFDGAKFHPDAIVAIKGLVKIIMEKLSTKH